MIRLFQLINVYPSKPVETNKISYVVLGHFDAMNTWIVSNQDSIQALSDPYGYAIRTDKDIVQAECAYIAGFREKDEDDFWENCEFPFLFITSIQLTKTEDISELAALLENRYNSADIKAKVYKTLDYSDLLVCLKTRLYAQGYKSITAYDSVIQEFWENNKVIRKTTMITIRKDALSVVSSETVDIQLRCTVSDRNAFDRFIKNLREECKSPVRVYGLLGQEDYIIIVRELPIDRWIEMYNGKKAIIRITELDHYGILDLRTEVLENV